MRRRRRVPELTVSSRGVAYKWTKVKLHLNQRPQLLEGGHGLKLETPFFGKKMGFFIVGVLEEDIKEQNLI